MSLALAKGKLAPFTVQPLPDAPPQYAEPSPIPAFESLDEARDYYTHRQKAGASPDELQAIIAPAPPADTTPTNEENNCVCTLSTTATPPLTPSCDSPATGRQSQDSPSPSTPAPRTRQGTTSMTSRCSSARPYGTSPPSTSHSP